MTNSCNIFNTEYQHRFTWKKKKREEPFLPSDSFAERIDESWQIDPRTASVPEKIDQTAKELIHKHILENAKSVYEITYKNPWVKSTDEDKKLYEGKQNGVEFQSELFAHIRRLYFDPHDEKILAPPMTAKRIFGYMRPALLHGGLSMYQETHGRTAGSIMLQSKEIRSEGKQKTTGIVCDY